MTKYKYLFLLALVAAVACERPVPPTSAEAAASFSVGAFLDTQVQYLQAEKPMVLKSVQTGSQPTETVQTSDLNWEEELSAFFEADINKPALQDKFIEERQTLPDGSTRINYRRIEGQDAPVASLDLLTAPTNQIKQLDAVILENNILFFSKRKLSLSTNSAGHISNYRVEGVQKLIFGDSLHYRIDANL